MLFLRRSDQRRSAKCKQIVAVLGALLMLIALPLAPAAEAQDSLGLPTQAEQQEAAADLMRQLEKLDGPLSFADVVLQPALGPAPWISFVPDRDPSTVAAWGALAKRIGGAGPEAAAADARLPDTAVAQDIERPNELGLNDVFETAQFVPGFGTGPGDTPFARVVGSLGLLDPPPPSDIECASTEDDGAIPLSNVAPVPDETTVACLGTIGDGPFGSTSGDVDFYEVTLSANERLSVSTAAQQIGSLLDTVIVLLDSNGNQLAGNDDFVGTDSFFQFDNLQAATYYIAVFAFGAQTADPFDSSSGSGARSQGPYELYVSRTSSAIPDIDIYLVDLEAGDTISSGFAMSRGGTIQIIDPTGRTGQFSGGSAAFIYPLRNPVRHIGNVGVDFVVETSGIHAITLLGGYGGYEGELRVQQAGLATEPGDDVQVIFLDFDGGTFNEGIFDFTQPEDAGAIRTLSPLVDWLPRWGLDASDEDAVIDSIIAEFTDDTIRDLQESLVNGNRDASGAGGELDLQVLNSRDHADPWGEPNVSRIIIGGSIAESGIPTIGIAQSIDPGNFDTEETALVLLDVLSAPAGASGSTLNQFPIAAPFTIIDLIGRSVGNIAAHEAGHFVGNWHTTNENEVPNLMDEGGNIAGTIGVGPDFTFGTDDDYDNDFGSDEYSRDEGFLGIENTQVRTAQAFSTGAADVETGEGLPANGNYNLQNVRSGRFLDADPTGAVNTSGRPAADDLWELVNIGGDLYNLRNVMFNTYLDADPNGNVDQSNRAASDDRWRIVPVENGNFYLFNVDRGRYLSDVGPDVRLSDDETTAERWRLSSVEPEAVSAFVGESITLQNRSTGRWLDSDGDGAVNQSRLQTADDVWRVLDAGDGYVFLQNAVTKRYLDADAADGNVDTSFVPSADDRWELVDDDGTATIRSAYFSGFLAAAGVDDGFNVSTSTSFLASSTGWQIAVIDDVE